MAHNIKIRTERLPIRIGGEREEYRVTCSCGWNTKAHSHVRAEEVAAHHAKFPHKTI